MKQLTIILSGLFFLIGISLKAQEITDIEYYFDTDPGQGNGIHLNIQNASTTVDTSFEIYIPSLSNGFHKFYLRIKNVNGIWSLTNNQTFYKVMSETTGNLVQMEYFIDSIKTPGSGTKVSVTAGSSVDKVFNVDVTSFPEGFHKFYVSAQDASGKWSLYSNSTFYKVKSDTLVNIIKLEYAFDGIGQTGTANQVSLSPGKDIEKTFDASKASLDTGQHLLYIRALDSYNNWSLVNIKDFRKTDCSELKTTELSAAICQGDSLKLSNGSWVKSAGAYFDTLVSQYGCDSIVTIQLKVNPVYKLDYSKSICQGSSYTWESSVYTTAGDYNKTLASAFGCDSILTLHLQVNPVFDRTENVSICMGENYKGHTANGTYSDTLQSKNGCDSIVNTILTVSTADSCITDVHLLSDFNKIRIYPNPTTGILEVSNFGNIGNGSTIRLFNSVGSLLQSIKISKDEKKIQIDLSAYPAGVYYVCFEGKQESYYHKIIKN
jgi:hypothetical protein